MTIFFAKVLTGQKYWCKIIMTIILSLKEVKQMQAVNRRIARFRKKAKMSQIQLAKAVGVSRCAVSAWEVGRATPKAKWLKPLAKALSCQISDLV